MHEKARICNTCSMERPINDFYKSPTSRGGRMPMCKFCFKAKYRDANNTCKECGVKMRSDVEYCWQCRGKVHSRLGVDRPWSDACGTNLWYKYTQKKQSIAKIAADMNRTEDMIRDKIAELGLDRQAAII